MGRMEDFYDLIFHHIYGGEITENFLDIDPKRNVILFNDNKIALNQFIVEYYLKLEKNEQPLTCKKCFSIFNRYFKKRPFEFTNWRGTLDFNKRNAKDIMIIAEAAGPKIATHLNLSYSLSNLPIEKNGRMDQKKIDTLLKQVKELIISQNKYKNEDINQIILKMKNSVRHKLWEYLYDLFLENETYFERLLNSLYITDMVKCNLGKTPEWESNTIWRECIANCKYYFYSEIRLIRPKLILIMGNSTYNILMSLLRDKNINVQEDDLLHPEKYLKDFPNRRFGYFKLDDEKTYFYHIYHNSYYYYGLEKEKLRPLYKKQNQEFISKEIFPKVLHWNKNS